MHSPFGKLKHSRRFQGVVDEIERVILSGELRPGDQLPPELDLKEMFGTGRGTVREALRVLEEKGLIAIRPGASGGAFVREADPGKLTEQLGLLAQTQSVSSHHIREFREAVEPMAASLAAGRVGRNGAPTLATAFETAERTLAAGDIRGFHRADADVHIAIAELTGNPLLVAVLRMVHEQVLDASDDYFLEGEGTLADNLEDLRALVDAVSRGHADDAGWLALDHIRKFHSCMKAAKEQGEDA